MARALEMMRRKVVARSMAFMLGFPKGFFAYDWV